MQFRVTHSTFAADQKNDPKVVWLIKLKNKSSKIVKILIFKMNFLRSNPFGLLATIKNAIFWQNIVRVSSFFIKKASFSYFKLKKQDLKWFLCWNFKTQTRGNLVKTYFRRTVTWALAASKSYGQCQTWWNTGPLFGLF